MKLSKFMNGIIVPILFAVYLYVLIKVILFKFGTMDVTFLRHQLQRNLGNPDNMIERMRSGNFTPFKEISNNIHWLSSHDLINLLGNIALFMPFGIFLILMTRHKKMSFIMVFILSLALSLSLECAQVIFLIGSFDVDDLILNVSGALLGFAVFKIVVKCMGNKSTATH
ncbi:VanZ family protein [Paenibacillus glacialis]|uniref:VanZ-like domain-containing protein n=1 Tax=Paenibacillus glacialis TaxID=494026 RepID=A0A168N2C1_9BACL|nr:VanZ family protein [Paenibacillus glacialis]OAB45311.1 hypothetical protein PGLA_03390 [Paenibacillus glacialis]